MFRRLNGSEANHMPRTLLLCAGLLVLIACGGGSTGPVVGSGPVASVSVAPITATSEGQSGSAAITVGLVLAAVSAGLEYTCGRITSGAAYCWGLNASGQLGEGSTTNSSTPVAALGSLTFAAVGA